MGRIWRAKSMVFLTAGMSAAAVADKNSIKITSKPAGTSASLVAMVIPQGASKGKQAEVPGSKRYFASCEARYQGVRRFVWLRSLNPSGARVDMARNNGQF